MNDDQLLRYSRHLLLNEIGVEGQERITQSHALVIGAGGLGSPAILYLATAGVGHITIVDNDTVDVTNLQRQIAHTTADVGAYKAQSAQQKIAALNPDVQVSTVLQRADAAVPLRRMFLHAWRLQFRHPVTGTAMQLQAELPAELALFLKHVLPDAH